MTGLPPLDTTLEEKCFISACTSASSNFRPMRHLVSKTAHSSGPHARFLAVTAPDRLSSASSLHVMVRVMRGEKGQIPKLCEDCKKRARLRVRDEINGRHGQATSGLTPSFKGTYVPRLTMLLSYALLHIIRDIRMNIKFNELKGQDSGARKAYKSFIDVRNCKVLSASVIA